jgi:hypothetical protein
MDTHNDNFDTIIHRIQTLETKFKEDSTDFKSKLDKIVILIERVSVLQEKEINNSQDITEIKSQLNNILDLQQRSVDTVHRRVDELVRDIVDYKELQEREVGIVKAEFQKWQNRGIGAWAVASILILFSQTLIGGYVRYMNTKIEHIEAEVIINDKKISNLETIQNLRHPNNQE